MQKVLDRAKELLGTPIDTRLVIYEVTPGYETGGYYSTEVPTKSVPIAYSEDETGIKEYLEQYEPSNGNHFEVIEQTLYERTVTTQHWAGGKRRPDLLEKR